MQVWEASLAEIYIYFRDNEKVDDTNMTKNAENNFLKKQ